MVHISASRAAAPSPATRYLSYVTYDYGLYSYGRCIHDAVPHHRHQHLITIITIGIACTFMAYIIMGYMAAMPCCGTVISTLRTIRSRRASSFISLLTARTTSSQELNALASLRCRTRERHRRTSRSYLYSHNYIGHSHMRHNYACHNDTN